MFEKFAQEYELEIDSMIYSGDEQRSANNAALFVFIGDKVASESEKIHDDINKKWDNGEGTVFINIMSDPPKAQNNIYNVNFNMPEESLKTIRHKVYEEFYNNTEFLIGLNEKIMQAKNKILQNGGLFVSASQINLIFVTRADDVMNVLLPEITLLMKQKLLEHFKIVYTDLFVLICENNESKDFAFDSANSMSFFREIEYIQSDEFQFKKPIEVVSDDIRLDVIKAKNDKLFKVIYLLSDKNAKGIINVDSELKNEEIITYISLLKNRNIESFSYDIKSQYYDNTQFEIAIKSQNSRQTYVSAGLAKLKRPNSAIAIMVLRFLYENIIDNLKDNSKKEMKNILGIFNIDENSIDKSLEKILYSDDRLYDLNGVMTTVSHLSKNEVENKSYAEIEELVFGKGCTDFFQRNFVNASYEKINKKAIYDEVMNYIDNNLLNNYEYGLYFTYKWTSSDEISHEIHEVRRNVQYRIEKTEKELIETYSSLMKITTKIIWPFQNKNIIGETKNLIINDIYLKKYKITRLKLTIDILNIYEEAILAYNQRIKDYIFKLEEILKFLKEKSVSILKSQDEYLSQNIEVFYKKVVSDIYKNLRDKYGYNFIYEDRFIGNIISLLNYDEGNELKNRIIHMAKKSIFKEKLFCDNFEEELLLRANVDCADSKALSKEELYEKLYVILEEAASVNVYLYDIVTNKRHIEKYFFGDYNSEFIQYAFRKNKENRDYKLGCIDEKRTSGIEKLNILGGFFIEDVLYAKNCIKYYETLIKNGYELHGIEKEKLPLIN